MFEDAELESLRSDFIRLRKYNGYSQMAVADLLQVGSATISNFEIAKHAPSAKIQAIIRRQVEEWENPPRKVEEPELAYPARTLACDTICPVCHEATPGPKEGGGLQPLCCVWCGAPLGLECEHCGVIETRRSAKFCIGCGNALAPEAWQEVQSQRTDAELSRGERVKRVARDEREKRRIRKARGEPEF